MKAEAPEKVYIEPSLDSIWGMAERSCESEVEYIRTDDFIEKACEYLEPILTEYAGFYVGVDILQHFKKYMKGEEYGR